ncbi:uncharacterized protein LOC120166522 [Hibiscus syriacus]|uniref:uncharacterized protein LOC120166522 n=1 Tax=Hibiscus syriacus TaxID=106335 RepID=UPI001920F4BE|nr:uncharacterized protein LOC120166522 [Hibiscus syriacus]
MVTLDRLPTKDKLARFGLDIDDVCMVCGSGRESRDHLFVDCPYAKDVWSVVLRLCGIRCVDFSWDQRLNWLIENLKGKTLRSRILKLAWIGFLYYIWEERNHRQFRGLSSTSEVEAGCL